MAFHQARHSGGWPGRFGVFEHGVQIEKLFKIGEVMRYTGLSRQTVHNYTVLGLITEHERTEGGHRLYTEEMLLRLERIKVLRETLTLSEIRDLLASGSPL
jgi:DNA-binding transcriptional MerR regulator